MGERKFTRALGKPGMAAQLRETVSQVVRESTVQSKLHSVEPIDYESFMLKYKTALYNDVQRELLLYPQDDFSQVIMPREYRTVASSPPLTLEDANLFTKECVKSYFSDWNLIHYKYSAYSGSYLDLSSYDKQKIDDILRNELYEIDVDVNQFDKNIMKDNGITKEGYLLKGPEGVSDRTMFSNIGSKSFKKRFCHLRQQVDGTYILEFFKDEKKGDAKIANMDFCSEIVRNPKRGKYCFELRMNGPHKSYTLAADSEVELQDWIMKLNTVLQYYKQQEEKRAAWLEKTSNSVPSSPQANQVYGTLKGLEQSMNPQLIKYSQETDVSISLARKKDRRCLFQMYLGQFHDKTSNSHKKSIEPYKEQFNRRIFVKCENISFKLQISIDKQESLCQIEPYYTTLSIFDARNNRKLSENFHFDINQECVKSMIKEESLKEGSLKDLDDLKNIPISYFSKIRQAIFNISNPHPDIFLVVRIDKILQGNISQTCEPYVRAAKDSRLAAKVQKQIQACCQRLGNYKMPFAWSARPLFRLYSNELDTSSDFPAIYRQEGNKIKDEELLKLLNEYRKPEKFNKLATIPGWIKIKVEAIADIPENCLTTSLAPLKPFPIPPTSEITLEVAEFESLSEKDVHPYTTLINHLYVYPQSISFDTQKVFNRARNIACIVEMKDSDSAKAQALKCIYGRPGSTLLISKVSCPVLHHNANPTWYEEIKIRLPIKLHCKHHLLFSFYHISCDIKKKENGIEHCLGYAWLPLCTKGRLTLLEEGSHVLPVATHLPDEYLSIQPLGLGKGVSLLENAGPETMWIDSQKPIFSVSVQINSTVFSKDMHLHNLFNQADKIIGASQVALPSDSETCKVLKAVHSIKLASAIKFLPTIFNELFTLLTCKVSEEVGHCIIDLLIHIMSVIYEAGRQEILQAYIKFIFVTPPIKNKCVLTVHEQLAKFLSSSLESHSSDVEFLKKFMVHSGLFFDVMVKSMAQHLLATGRIKMHRPERFSKDYQEQIEQLIRVISSDLMTKYKEMPQETVSLNKSVAEFLKRCLSNMDRGFVFRIISSYVDNFVSVGSRTLHDYKYNFLQIICNHEHFVSLNLPLAQAWSSSKDEVDSDFENSDKLCNEYYLTDNFCKYHFLVGLILQQVKLSLNESVYLRKIAISTLRNLLAKHELDDRYKDKGQMGRIASLYIPWISIVLENLDRLEAIISVGQNETQQNLTNCASNSNNAITISNNYSYTSTPVKLSQRLSTNVRDSTYLSAIAGQNLANGYSCTSIASDASTISSLNQSNTSQETAIHNSEITESDGKEHKGHARSVSVSHNAATTRCEKFQPAEIQDLLICFLFVVKYMEEDQLVLWWQQCSDIEIQKFLTLLELCLEHFKYLGKKQPSAIVKQDLGKPKTVKSMTLPARMAPPDFSDTTIATGTLQPQNVPTIKENLLEHDFDEKVYNLQANLAVEVGLVVLDCLGLFCSQFKALLLEANGSNPILQQIVNVYLTFLKIGQSENLFRHVFAGLRAFLNNYSVTLFQGNPVLCGRLCYELLRCCNSKLSSIRQESCALLYLLMRSNFEFTSRKGLTRVHLQVIISVSQMLGNVIGLNNSRFQESLSLINSYACSDKVMKGTSFPLEVQDLNKRIRTVLMATAQMREHTNDPEMLLDLEHSLANSYASTPELRQTWLETMARNHLEDENYSEAACCQLHISALIAEYLKLNNLNDWGAEAFEKLSKNIPSDEKGLKLDVGVQDIHYNENILLKQLQTCAEILDKAERFELLGHLYRLIIPIYEKARNYQALASCYSHLNQAYNKIIQVNKSGKRLLGRFYKVSFFGSAYFDQEHGIEYIYKEPKVTSLSEISERLHNLYAEKFGSENVKMIMDSAPVQISELDPKIGYIQVTHVLPYFDETELEVRLTDFERNHDISRFMFETPFTQQGNKARGNPQDQWKRRTILTTQRSFPYVKKRIKVIDKKILELSPIQVALDEMRQRVQELEDVCLIGGSVDAKKLQLKLQGSVCVTVNAGPLAYAHAFLDSAHSCHYPDELVQELKDVFREFVKICYTALQINSKLISCDQHEYQEALRENYQKFCQNLSSLLEESVWPDEHTTSFKRNSAALFNAISGTTNSHSSTA